ncbi:MAG: aldo/keto reductase, partial [Veillonella sp.]|nr:aldo/keto reductase [Veillonella sp.]
IQNHFSLLYRTLETTGILDYCKEEDITVFSYMVLEQGALSGKYTVENPLPAGTRRGEAFPPATLAKLQPLFDYMAELATKYDASTAQIATTWAVNKGTVPIIGVTKVAQVDDAAKAGSIELAADEVARMDEIAIATGVTVKGEWEQSM